MTKQKIYNVLQRCNILNHWILWSNWLSLRLY